MLQGGQLGGSGEEAGVATRFLPRVRGLSEKGGRFRLRRRCFRGRRRVSHSRM